MDESVKTIIVSHKLKSSYNNKPCPCGSGKKFKKCCRQRVIKGQGIKGQQKHKARAISA